MNDSQGKLSLSLWSLLLAAIVACAGCGGAETGGIVQGKVTSKGGPIERGSILFVPDSGPTATANFGPGGVYHLLNAHKTEFIAPGSYRVVIVPGSKERGLLPEAKNSESLPVPVDVTSTATTPLRYDVKYGSNTIDIDLTSLPAKSKAGK